MELRSGYRQTEVEVVPADWELKRICDFATVSSGGTPSRSNPAYWGGTIPWITTSQIDFTLITGADQFITEEGIKNSAAKIFPAGTLIVAMYGQGKTRGKVGVLGFETTTNQACAAIFLMRGVSYQYVFHYLASQYEGIRNLSNSGTQENLNGFLIKSIQIPLPPLPEQRAIAAALSDVDALLASLDALIAKKRDLKQAAMQQLLTGKQRLPGFSVEWEMKRFGEIASPRKERSDSRSAGIQDFCIELEHIEQGTGRLLGNTSTGSHSSLKSVFQVGDVLFGKLRAYLRKYWLADCKGVCSTEIWALAANQRLITSEFLFHLVTDDGFIEAASTAYGTHMPRSDWAVIKNYEVSLPRLCEQTAIASVLSEMDAEITVLEARRDKTRALKQGMMQELLTGRVRLV